MMRGWFDEIGDEGVVTAARVESRGRDLRPELPSIDCPVYIRVGGLDVATPPAWSAEIAEELPSASVEVVDGAGHFLPLEDAEGTVAGVLAFLRA